MQKDAKTGIFSIANKGALVIKAAKIKLNSSGFKSYSHYPQALLIN